MEIFHLPMGWPKVTWYFIRYKRELAYQLERIMYYTDG